MWFIYFPHFVYFPLDNSVYLQENIEVYSVHIRVTRLDWKRLPGVVRMDDKHPYHMYLAPLEDDSSEDEEMALLDFRGTMFERESSQDIPAVARGDPETPSSESARPIAKHARFEDPKEVAHRPRGVRRETARKNVTGRPENSRGDIKLRATSTSSKIHKLSNKQEVLAAQVDALKAKCKYYRKSLIALLERCQQEKEKMPI